MSVPHLTTTRLHVLLALAALLTGTAPGVAAAVLVLAVVVARELVRHRLDASVAASVPVGARVLPAPQQAPVLDAPGGTRHRLAG